MSNYWGSVNLDKIKEAVEKVPAKFKNDEKYGRQLMIDAKQWDDGNFSLSVYNKDTKERIVIGSLRLSQFQNDGAAPSKPAAEAFEAKEDDLPF